MYLPSHFEETRSEALCAVIEAHPLGLLITQDEWGKPQADPVPWLLSTEPTAEGPAGTLLGHVARANPLWREAANQPVLVVFQGANAYVSPGWYPSKADTGKVVPTWNYVTVQARGTLHVLDDAQAAHAMVSRLTVKNEATQARPWAVEDAPADFIATLLRAIVVIEVPLQSMVGKFKLSQNRSEADRDGVIQGLRATSTPASTAVADAMTGHFRRDGNAA